LCRRTLTIAHVSIKQTHITNFTLAKPIVQLMDVSVQRNVSSPLLARPRARVACSDCRRRKVRCNVVLSGRPCTNCRLDGFECVTRPKKQRVSRISADTTQAADTDRVSVTNQSQDHCTRIPAIADSQLSSRPTFQADSIEKYRGPTSVATEAPFVESQSPSSYEFSNLSEPLFQSALSGHSTSKLSGYSTFKAHVYDS